MKPAYKIFALYAVLLFLSVGVIPYLIVQKRVKEYSAEKDAAILQRWYENKLKVYIERLSPADGKALLVTNGRAEFKGAYPTQFTIAETEAFNFAFDKATKAQFRIKKIEKDGVVIEYEFVRDYRPFGKNFVMNHKGLVNLKWTKNS